MVTVVLPIYNEEKILVQNSPSLEKLKQYAELIFVDGRSTDRSVEIAGHYGKTFLSKKGRAAQMNYVAGVACGDILLFLHADSIISAATLKSIEKNLSGNGFIGGCLTQRIDKNGLSYRFIETFGNIRARLTRVFYGDQGIFVRKDIFSKIGGFPEVPIMEDIIFTKKLRRYGKTIILRDKILVSSRRWEARGIMNTLFLHSFLILLYWMKMPLDKISSYYEDLR